MITLLDQHVWAGGLCQGQRFHRIRHFHTSYSLSKEADVQCILVAPQFERQSVTLAPPHLQKVEV